MMMKQDDGKWLYDGRLCDIVSVFKTDLNLVLAKLFMLDRKTNLNIIVGKMDEPHVISLNEDGMAIEDCPEFETFISTCINRSGISRIGMPE